VKTSGSFTFLLVLYMLLCAIVLLYAIVGIFGAAFVLEKEKKEANREKESGSGKF